MVAQVKETTCHILQEVVLKTKKTGNSEYVRCWEDVPKIRHDGEGKTEIIVDDELTSRCYSLVPGGALGGLEKQGPCTMLEKYAISYPR